MSHSHFTAAALTVDPTRPDFSNEALDAVVQDVERCHASVTRASYEAVWHAFRAGIILLSVKDSLSHGKWIPWLNGTFGNGRTSLSARTCQRYMEVARTLLMLPEFEADNLKQEPSKATRASFLNALELHRLSSVSKVLLLSRTSERLIDVPSAEDTIQTTGAPIKGAESVDENWLTPSNIVECATNLLNAIDLDPCGVADAQFRLPAAQTLTAIDDGLAVGSRWHGRVFIHPPATKTRLFVHRAVEGFETGEFAEGLLFIAAETDASYMALLKPFPKGFLHRRPSFSTPEGLLVQPPTAYMFVFLTRISDRVNSFADSCGSIADIYCPHCS